mmetsp:Transcript_38668/g.125465  ORF Transcript_38668/g.125465 Transcript_38668/m.125465 type:complete len:272 (+) Transcript_38668:43-858(+)
MKKFAMNKDQLMGGGASASPWGGGGYGGSSAVGPSTSWKPPSEEESLEQLQKRIDDHDSAIKDSLHRTTAMANQTREVGAATLRDIHMQGEQLKGIAANQQKVEENLQTSNKLLRGMESWRGTFVNWATGTNKEIRKTVAHRDPRGEDKSEEAQRAAESAVAPTHLASRAPPPRASHPPPLPLQAQLEAAGGSGWRREQVYGGGSAAPVTDECDALSQISSIVGDLKLQADAMNKELKLQSGQLDAIDSKADRNASQLEATNMRTKKLSRR